MFMKKLSLTVAFALALISSTSAQNMKCPICTGPNVALQLTSTACICATITGVVGPAGPQGPIGPAGPTGPAGSLPASTCAVDGFTERWSGSAWVCTATKFITAQ